MSGDRDEELAELERALGAMRSLPKVEPPVGLAARAFAGAVARPKSPAWLDGFVDLGWRVAMASTLTAFVAWGVVWVSAPSDSADATEVAAAIWLEEAP